ncbi:hypothetical protein SPSYN_02091 [Sporotomaculum syntrophicum]|uniref:Uncharacterized protein n=1 Tax=Sporotomaculum syntrophicum TaxID=182264 RepID=A0A9D2WMU5_9FIRM|nr:permease prefix domain 1-containing protein [Sporotomaculum syntrophicum]KAF1084315.1 hypothetical protein SPSYN_02091 [Sporotomaculum syntrophicum]
MLKNKKTIDDKVKNHIEHLFDGVGASQQLFDLKEELATNLKEKIADYRSKGMEDEQALQEAVISMGDLSGLVDDMRKLGRDKAKQAVYSTKTARISLAGIIAGVLLTLFGSFTVAMLYFINLSAEEAFGPGIFIVAGGALFTYSILTMETGKKYAMNKIRAASYALAVGSLLFGIFVAAVTGLTSDEIYVSIASSMLFVMAGVGLFLFLCLTGTDRLKTK